MTFGLACCAVEMMHFAAPRFAYFIQVNSLFTQNVVIFSSTQGCYKKGNLPLPLLKIARGGEISRCGFSLVSSYVDWYPTGNTYREPYILFSLWMPV